MWIEPNSSARKLERERTDLVKIGGQEIAQQQAEIRENNEQLTQREGSFPPGMPPAHEERSIKRKPPRKEGIKERKLPRRGVEHPRCGSNQFRAQENLKERGEGPIFSKLEGFSSRIQERQAITKNNELRTGCEGRFRTCNAISTQRTIYEAKTSRERANQERKPSITDPSVPFLYPIKPRVANHKSK